MLCTQPFCAWQNNNADNGFGPVLAISGPRNGPGGPSARACASKYAQQPLDVSSYGYCMDIGREETDVLPGFGEFMSVCCVRVRVHEFEPGSRDQVRINIILAWSQELYGCIGAGTGETSLLRLTSLLVQN